MKLQSFLIELDFDIVLLHYSRYLSDNASIVNNKHFENCIVKLQKKQCQSLIQEGKTGVSCFLEFPNFDLVEVND